jgi:hypothetical protein
MHTLLNTRLTRAALKAARPARRHVVRALRHHAARTRALAEQLRDAKAVDGVRSWFHTFFSALRGRANARRLSLRTLLRKPTQHRALPSPQHALGVAAPNVSTSNGTALAASRRPRRLLASNGWFAFAAR